MSNEKKSNIPSVLLHQQGRFVAALLQSYRIENASLAILTLDDQIKFTLTQGHIHTAGSLLYNFFYFVFLKIGANQQLSPTERDEQLPPPPILLHFLLRAF